MRFLRLTLWILLSLVSLPVYLLFGVVRSLYEGVVDWFRDLNLVWIATMQVWGEEEGR